MNITRNIYLLLPSLLILSACGSEPEPTKTEAPAIQQKPVATTPTYRAVVDADYPPYGSRDEYGKATGFDVDVLNAIAEHQDFSVSILPMNWESVLESMETGTYQITMGGILEADIENPRHLENYSFSVPYAYGYDAIATLPDTQNITSFEDLAGHRVGVLADSGHVNLVKELQANSEGVLLAEPSTFLAYQGLFLDKVDAVLADEGVLRHLQRLNPDDKISIHHEGERLSEHFELVYMIDKDNPELNEKIQLGMDQIVADGTYADIYQKWFGIEPTILPTN